MRADANILGRGIAWNFKNFPCSASLEARGRSLEACQNAVMAVHTGPKRDIISSIFDQQEFLYQQRSYFLS